MVRFDIPDQSLHVFGCVWWLEVVEEVFTSPETLASGMGPDCQPSVSSASGPIFKI